MYQRVGGKQATRGQRQIYEENKQTLLCYLLASVSSSILVLSLDYFLFEPTNAVWVGFVFSIICEFGAVGLMSSMMKSIRNERNQVVDAGLDLNDPNAFGEYCKDVVILSVMAQLLSLLSSYFYLLLLIVPMFALFKLWVKVLAPWIFAPAEESDEKDDGKKRQKRQKFVHVRR